jgi:hypothetical protein
MFRGGCSANFEHIVWTDGNSVVKYHHESLKKIMSVSFDASIKLYNMKPSPDS